MLMRKARRILGAAMTALAFSAVGASAQTERPLTEAERPAFEEALTAYVDAMRAFEAGAMASSMPDQMLLWAAREGGLEVDELIEQSAARSRGFEMVRFEVDAPTAAPIAIETGDALCVVLPLFFELRRNGQSEASAGFVYAVFEDARWGFVFGPEGGLATEIFTEPYETPVCGF